MPGGGLQSPARALTPWDAGVTPSLGDPMRLEHPPTSCTLVIPATLHVDEGTPGQPAGNATEADQAVSGPRPQAVAAGLACPTLKMKTKALGAWGLGPDGRAS